MTFMPNARILAATTALICSPAFLGATPAYAQDGGFRDCLAGIKADALKQGVPASVIDRAFQGLTPDQKVVDLDNRQPEFSLTYAKYVGGTVSLDRIQKGQQKMAQHRALLDQLQAEYGIPPQYLMAFWGIETNYGTFMGDFRVVRSVATLACMTKRKEFFSNETVQALRILNSNHMTSDQMRGSWAGAMGQPQFMPSSYLQYAVDFDGDGRRDIWQSTPDALASIANYLSQFGWQRGQSWGREVRVPSAKREAIAEAVPKRAEGCYALRNMTERRPLSRWRALGVTRMDGKPLSIQGPDAALVDTGTRQFLVTASYDAILGYNCAHYYALSVGLLANRLR